MRDNNILEIFKKIKTIERSNKVGDRETKQKGLPTYLEIWTQVIEGRILTRVLVDQANLRIITKTCQTKVRKLPNLPKAWRHNKWEVC